MNKNNKYFVVKDNLIPDSFYSCSKAFKTAKQLSKNNKLKFEVWGRDKYYMNKYLLAIYKNGLRVYENYKTDEVTIIEKEVTLIPATQENFKKLMNKTIDYHKKCIKENGRMEIF